MRLLISGSRGMLGQAIFRIASIAGHDCIALDRQLLGPENPGAIPSFFDGTDYFVHAAANTNVENCESDPASCYRDNVLLTEQLASAARRHRVPMAMISSTGVYGNYQSSAYSEYDDARPTTHHHKSKVLAENLTLAADWSNLVVRTGWLFGGLATAPKNFVAGRIREARAAGAGSISSNREQHGCPTYVDDLARRLLDLIAANSRGIFNCVNEGSASRFEYVQAIVTQVVPKVEVLPMAARNFNRIAPVSNNEMAINWRMSQSKLGDMRSWQEALRDYLESDDIRSLA